ncbi:hypothetical protein, partial [Rhizobium johnstonii]|uniref:hypothetical protein n=1 Tax=Rhizobium johnstonii TaxID=3019933 RepID=UPI003F9BF274
MGIDCGSPADDSSIAEKPRAFSHLAETRPGLGASGMEALRSAAARPSQASLHEAASRPLEDAIKDKLAF